MSLSDLLSSAATEAQSVFAELGGAAPGEPNFAGPDGVKYTGVFRPASAFEQAAAEERGLTRHGQQARAILILSATRDQFSAPPYSWRLKSLTRLVPVPAQICAVQSVEDSDPYHFVFVLQYHQPATA